MASYTVAGGDIHIWVDNGVICIKVTEPYGDPVELNSHEADELSELLKKLADEISDELPAKE